MVGENEFTTGLGRKIVLLKYWESNGQKSEAIRKYVDKIG